MRICIVISVIILAFVLIIVIIVILIIWVIRIIVCVVITVSEILTVVLVIIIIIRLLAVVKHRRIYLCIAAVRIIICVVTMVRLRSVIVWELCIGINICLILFYNIANFNIIGNIGNSKVIRMSAIRTNSGIMMTFGNNIAYSEPLVKNTSVNIHMRKVCKRLKIILFGKTAVCTVNSFIGNGIFRIFQLSERKYNAAEINPYRH